MSRTSRLLALGDDCLAGGPTLLLTRALAANEALGQARGVGVPPAMKHNL